MGPRGAKRFWHGYYSGKAVDHFTGGVIPIVESASRQEYDLVDPRCKRCGGATNFVRFSPGDRSRPADQRNPRIWFDCMVAATPACAKTQVIACSTDYRLLVPLWRTDALYHELKESHGTYEATHDWWRDRYKVAADDLGLRPKVRDLGFHRLRANVAAFVEWLRICYCQGWLGSPKRNNRKTKRGFQDRAERIQGKLANMRVAMGIAAPYGANAEQLGLGQRTPPSRRRRGAPPGQTTLDIPDP